MCHSLARSLASSPPSAGSFSLSLSYPLARVESMGRRHVGTGYERARRGQTLASPFPLEAHRNRGCSVPFRGRGSRHGSSVRCVEGVGMCTVGRQTKATGMGSVFTYVGTITCRRSKANRSISPTDMYSSQSSRGERAGTGQNRADPGRRSAVA